jgi:uncharacterized protein (DUF58 family)
MTQIRPAPRLPRFTPRFAARLLQRGLPANATLALRVRWPLAVLLAAVVAQAAMPDPVFTTTAVALLALYLGSWFWVRALARGVALERTRRGTLIVAGDTLEEEFLLHNRSSAPLVWGEVVDESDLPGYAIGRVVSAGSHSSQRWRTAGVCRQRGLYRLGPHRILSGDPLRLFDLTIRFDDSEPALIYPRVARLPAVPLPRGYASGDERTRRPLLGALPAPSVRPYQPHDELRFVHWRQTAHRGGLMVREMEQEPSGDIWVVLDAGAAAQQRQAEPGAPEYDTLETAVTAAAGLAGHFLQGGSRRGVGLVAASGEASDLIVVPPHAGSAHLWRILTALAPVHAAATPLHDLLAGLAAITGSRSSVIVVTPSLHDPAAVERWTAQLVRLTERGLATGLLLVTTGDTEAAAAEVAALLAGHGVPVERLPVDLPLATALTHRRRRTVLRTTPRGGTIAVEVEEEVG